MASKQQEKYIGQPCHSCDYGTYEVPTNGQEWHVVCNECNAIFLVYEPLPHQDRFHKDPRKFKMFAGGKNPIAAFKRFKFGGTLRA